MVGMKNEPRFPMDVINPTALPTKVTVCGNSTGIVRTMVRTPIAQRPTKKPKNHRADPRNTPVA
jgi:hypothetical protein